MARYFKKRRPVGPSKNEQKLQRNREAEARERNVGRLSDAFPQVERLTVRLELLSPQQHSLAEPETRVFKAQDRIELSVPCPGRCGQGSFNLAGKVQAVIESHEASADATGTCQEPLFAGATEVCGVRLSCKIEVQYAPEPKTA
ncbi:MAG: hypothetical protein HY553_18100 [Elusimicrobia bacterium]|nr:hypothetical protein [Elusimicrobiota bacterium]